MTKRNSEDGEAVDQLRQAFDQAALTPERWMHALDRLAVSTGSRHGQLIGLGDANAPMFNWVSGFHGKVTEEIMAPNLHDPDINFRVAAGLPADEGEVIGEADYDRIIPTLGSQTYLDFCDRMGIRHGAQANLRKDPAGLVGLAILRPDRTLPEQHDLFAQAVPLAATAVRIQAALDHQGTQLVAGTLDAMRAAAIVLDGTGRIRAVTPSAERLLASGYPFRDRQGLLIPAPGLAGADRVRTEIAARLRYETTGSSHTSVVLDPSSGPAGACLADLVRMPRGDWAMHFQPRLIVVIRGGREAREDSASLLQAALGLTRAEAEVAGLLAAGHARNTIAAKRGVSENTVRNQLKSIFLKSGVSREAQLISQIRDLLG